MANRGKEIESESQIRDRVTVCHSERTREIDFDGDGPHTNMPVANAGKDQTVMADTIVTLDASQSSDQGQTISFSWSQSSG